MNQKTIWPIKLFDRYKLVTNNYSIIYFIYNYLIHNMRQIYLYLNFNLKILHFQNPTILLVA